MQCARHGAGCEKGRPAQCLPPLDRATQRCRKTEQEVLGDLLGLLLSCDLLGGLDDLLGCRLLADLDGSCLVDDVDGEDCLDVAVDGDGDLVLADHLDGLAQLDASGASFGRRFVHDFPRCVVDQRIAGAVGKGKAVVESVVDKRIGVLLAQHVAAEVEV